MKYIFFDIDNTLISHVIFPHIPEQTRKAIKLLKANGHVPAIATGRAGFLTFLAAKEFEINNLVCSGGAQIFIEGKEIFNAFFPDGHLAKFLETAKKFPNLSVAADDNLFTLTKNQACSENILISRPVMTALNQ